MKIDDSPFQFRGTSPVDKLRGPAPSLDRMLDELDLSFLDMLTSLSGESSAATAKPDQAAKAPTSEKAQPAETTSEKNQPPKLSLVEKATTASAEEVKTQVEQDMILLQEELSAEDVQYMKQVVVPGLPILVGSVPFNSIFPAGEDGEISYRGFDISPKLAELIEKGYRTGRPIRVDLDANSAVVLKIRNGQVSAEFVSADKAAGLVMQQELDDLRNRMAARQLPVGTLEYKYQDPRQSGRQSDSEERRDEGASET